MSRGLQGLADRQPGNNGTLSASTHRHRLSPERLVQCVRAVVAGEVPVAPSVTRRLTGQQTACPACAGPTARRPHLTRDRRSPAHHPRGTASPKNSTSVRKPSRRTSRTFSKAPPPRPSPPRHPRLPDRHRELTGNAHPSIRPRQPGRALGLRPTQNGMIGAQRAGQYDQPLSVQIGGSWSTLGSRIVIDPWVSRLSAFACPGLARLTAAAGLAGCAAT